jgi:hypothetical protein
VSDDKANGEHRADKPLFIATDARRIESSCGRGGICCQTQEFTHLLFTAGEQVRRNSMRVSPRLALQGVTSYIEQTCDQYYQLSMKGLAMGDKSKKDKDKTQKQKSTKQEQKSKATQDRNQKKP